MRALAALFAAAVLAGASAADAKVQITIDKSAQRIHVAVDGEPRWIWPVSTGRAGRDTPSGAFKAFRMERDHYSKEWDDAPMPYSIFFTRQGHAIHGSYEVKKLGNPASAGCVRLHPDNAAKLFALVEEQGVLNTSVEVVGDVRVALARAPARTAAAPEPSRGMQRHSTELEELPPPRNIDPRTAPAYGEPAPPGFYDEPGRPAYRPPQQAYQQPSFQGDFLGYDIYGRPVWRRPAQQGLFQAPQGYYAPQPYQQQPYRRPYPDWN